MRAGTTSSRRRRSAPRWRWPRSPTNSDLTVVLLGTPAEEAGGGKVLMLEAGAFDDIAATVMLHAGPLDIARARSLALSQVAVGYVGPRGARRRRAVSGAQRRGRDHRRAGGDRPAATAVGARADGARHRHRRRAGHQRHPRHAPRWSTRCAPTTPGRCANSRAGCPTASSRARSPRAATTTCRGDRARLPRTDARPVAGRRRSAPRWCGWAGLPSAPRSRPRSRSAAPTWATSRR